MTSSDSLTIEQCIALKLMVDIRLFDTGQGRQPVQTLAPALAQGLAQLQPGGVILFRENLADAAQIRALTDALRASVAPTLLIGIDQEGGCVTRLPRTECTSFSGNMALAACPADERRALALAMAAAQATELEALGINVNFVPSLDVNSNPANPVIHVRAFSDNPDLVAELGAAVTRGTQDNGVAAALKHFPGHGDTSDDSHTGLPLVSRDASEARAIDLKPFQQVIGNSAPAMVMTAHIQYPALDPSYLEGTRVVRPATLSRPILTDLLRTELGFDGVVITDALDMGAISQMLSPLQATLACFQAGADIALMPLPLRDQASLDALHQLVADIAGAVRAGELDEAELRASAARVQALQGAYALAGPSSMDVIGCAAHRALEARIAAQSVTLLSGRAALPRACRKVHLLMPGEQSAAAMAGALQAARPELAVTAQSLEALDVARERALVADCDAYIVGVSEPGISAVVVGGAEDLPNLQDASPVAVVKTLLADSRDRHNVVLMLNSPYRAAEFYPLVESVLATYDGAPVGIGGAPGPAFTALADVLTGASAPAGELPVSGL